MEEDKINNINKALDNENNESIMKLTSEQIMKDKNDILQRLQLTSSELKAMHKKLKVYRYVEEINDINYGAYIRWIKLTDPNKINLTNGGIIIDIKIMDEGIHLICKNNMNRVMQIKLNEILVFQKLTDQEKIILSVINYLK